MNLRYLPMRHYYDEDNPMEYGHGIWDRYKRWWLRTGMTRRAAIDWAQHLNEEA